MKKYIHLLAVIIMVSLLYKVNICSAEEYSFKLSWGSNGDNDGEFKNPLGIEIHYENEKVYVGEWHGHRIQIFDLNGNYISQFGSYGSGDGQFNVPFWMTINNDTLYVADRYNNRIQIFDLDGNFLGKFGENGSGDGQFNGPTTIEIGNNDKIYVVEGGNNRVQVFDKSLNYLFQWGEFGSGDGQFNNPHGIKIDTINNIIYISDHDNHRIQTFDMDGNFIAKFGEYGSGNGDFNKTFGIDINSSGNLLIGDSWGDRLQRFDADGNFIEVVAFPGTGDGQLDQPGQIVIVPNGDLYITDEFNHRVQVFSFTPDSVQICDQEWMTRNLNVTHYRNGDSIPEVRDSTEWSNLSTGAWCYYNNNSANDSIHGKLYNWYAVNDSRGLAPAGWRIPTDDEWKTLEMCLGMSQSQADSQGYRGTNEGGKLKSTGSIEDGDGLWFSPNTNATNATRFRAAPSGSRMPNSVFHDLGYHAAWWGSGLWCRHISYNEARIRRYENSYSVGLSVRCIRVNNSNSITTLLENSKYCQSEQIDIPFEVSGTYNSANKFLAQLSDSNGDFSNPILLDSMQGTVSGTIKNVRLFDTLSPGSIYRIRVVSTDPIVTGMDNGEDITINPLPDMTITGDFDACEGTTIIYKTSRSAGDKIDWIITGGVVDGPNDETVITVTWKNSGQGRIILLKENVNTGCADSVEKVVTIKAAPYTPMITQNGDTLVSSSGSGNQWYFNINNIPGENDLLPGATGKQYIIQESGFYAVRVDSNGCWSAFSDSFVGVESKPNSNDELTIYPNPTSGEINIILPTIDRYKSELVLSNFLGIELQRYMLNEVSNMVSIKMNLNDLPNGIYYLSQIFQRRSVTTPIILYK